MVNKSLPHPDKLKPVDSLKIIVAGERLSSDIVAEFVESYLKLNDDYTKLKEVLQVYRQHKHSI